MQGRLAGKTKESWGELSLESLYEERRRVSKEEFVGKNTFGGP